MTDAENTMVDRLNKEIKFAVVDYKQYGRTPYYERLIAKIYGMLEMLRIATDKNYFFNENGVYVKED